MREPKGLNTAHLKNLVRQALAEDIGSGDATTLALVPVELEISAELRTRQDCVVAGLPVVEAVYAELDGAVGLEPLFEEGQPCAAGDVLARLAGSAQAILGGERVALNFLQRLSGIATVTRAYVDALSGSRTRLLDTRKTTPGLRFLEKYAVSQGGGQNHRFGLYDMIMIKDNHYSLFQVAEPGGIAGAVANCREQYPGLEIEVEADTIEQVRDALEAKADYILLDNMSDEEMAAAVKLRDQVNSQVLLEASGGIGLGRMGQVAAAGVDFVSVGALTHSVSAIDIGLDLEEPREYPASMS